MRSGSFRGGGIFLWATLAALTCVIPAEGADEGPSTAPRAPGRVELKLVVPADKVGRAEATLMQPGTHTVDEDIMFFDTSDRALAAAGIILRARWKSDGRGDTTVKLRDGDSARALSDAEKGIAAEEDWVDDIQPLISRSVTNVGLGKSVLQDVIHGTAAPRTLFNAEQIQLIEARLAPFPWNRLESIGPIQAKLWPKGVELKDFPKPLTAERWHLQKQGRVLDILELSVKASPKSDKAAKALATKFFTAAAEGGFGSPSGVSKTQLVLDFFKASE